MPAARTHPGSRGAEGILDGTEHVDRQVLDSAAEGSVRLSSVAARRLLAIVGTLVVLFGATYVVPAAAPYRPIQPGDGYVPFWNVLGREVLGEGKAAENQARETERLVQMAEQGDGEQRADIEGITQAPSAPKAQEPGLAGVFPPYEPLASELEAPAVQLENAAAIAPYYRRLTLAQLGVPGVVARAAMWGDSVLGNDGITHALRRRMQARFGDAGHGFMSLGRYNPAYFHQGIRFQDKGGWRRCEIIFRCEDDGRYGYAGATATSSGGGESWFATTRQGTGSRVSRFELWYGTSPAGGKFQIRVDDEAPRIVNTAAAEVGDAVNVITVEDGYHEFSVRAIGGGVVRGYGVVLEREGPGVVWDSLGLIGSFTQRLDYQDPEHIAWQIAQRNPDLLTFILGGNDVQREKMDLVRSTARFEEEYVRVLRKFRAGKPGVACVVLSLVDHGERVGPHEIRTRRIVPELVAAERRVALAEGCAFFDTFTAMGGNGSMGRWYRASPQLAGADFAHPTQAGHEVVAALFHSALMYGYAEYRKAQTGEKLPEFATDGVLPGAPPASAPN